MTGINRKHNKDHRYCRYGTKEFESYVFNTSQDFIRKMDERKVYCQYCGHSMYLPYFQQEAICSYCQRKVKKEGKLLFKDKMRVLLNEEKYEKGN